MQQQENSATPGATPQERQRARNRDLARDRRHRLKDEIALLQTTSTAAQQQLNQLTSSQASTKQENNSLPSPTATPLTIQPVPGHPGMFQLVVTDLSLASGGFHPGSSIQQIAAPIPSASDGDEEMPLKTAATAIPREKGLKRNRVPRKTPGREPVKKQKKKKLKTDGTEYTEQELADLAEHTKKRKSFMGLATRVLAATQYQKDLASDPLLMEKLQQQAKQDDRERRLAEFKKKNGGRTRVYAEDGKTVEKAFRAGSAWTIYTSKVRNKEWKEILENLIVDPHKYDAELEAYDKTRLEKIAAEKAAKEERKKQKAASLKKVAPAPQVTA